VYRRNAVHGKSFRLPVARLTLTDYARHRNCYPRAVEAALAAGRITRGADGLIDSDQADLDWSKHTNPIKAAAAKRNGAAGQAMRKELSRKPAESAGTPAKPAATATDLADYAKARAEREHYQAELARLSLGQKQEKLISREEWTSAETAFMRTLRDSLLAIPDRMADELAAEGNAVRVREMLSGELLSTLSRALAEKEMRRAQ
jgi:hypothetical protein